MRAGGGVRQAELIPITQTVIEDSETPVSAFLKLRGSGPAFLLESAEQGQRVEPLVVHRLQAAVVLRWSLADGGDPYELAAAEVAAAGRKRRGRTCRRSRAARSASSATTACASVERSPGPTRTRSACRTWR